ncbi:S-adenosyl-L-methionine-dependent methyltransferase [Amanita muscaria]
MEQIRQLLDLINSAVETLDKTCTANGTKVPSLNESFHPTSEAFREDPAAAQATILIGSAALQLAAIVLPPQVSLYNIIGGLWNSAAIRTALESSVTEVLREAGPEGLHVDAIEEKTGIDAQKMARCLRTLTVHHVYREVTPDVFTNTRLSSMLDTSKPSQDIVADPDSKHDNNTSLPSLAGHHLDEMFKSSAYLWETLSDPQTGKSDEPGHAAIGKALSNGKGFFDYLAQPDQKYRQKRFDMAMRATQSFFSQTIFLQAYDWKSLPNDALVVDVGGGVGNVSMVLAKEHPNLNIIIQDQAYVIENGTKFWEAELPDALNSGRVKFEVHDFFKPQPQKAVNVFLMKHIIHDWSDEYSAKILKQLRGSATPDTRLICLEAIIPYACSVSNAVDHIAGAAAPEAPEPLPAHWGLVSSIYYYLDMTMLVANNAKERTIGQFEKLFKAAGWKITTVRRASGNVTLAAIEAVPI